MQNTATMPAPKLVADNSLLVDSEKEIHEMARVARLMRRQERRFRATVAKIESAGAYIAVRVGTSDQVPLAQVQFVVLKLTK